MTPQEIVAEAQLIQAEIGSGAELFISMNNKGWSDKAISCGAYHRGIGRSDSLFRIDADDWSEMFQAVRAKWAEFADEHRKRTVSKMALAIIRITDEQGECSDAALRADDFSASEVAALGEAACARASEMAGRAPFSIVSGAKSNAA